jgi:nicotinamidase-related amidase
MPTALLIIDVQSALCVGEHAAFDAAAVIGRINAVAERVRAAAGTVVVIQHESADGAFAHGSPGWQLAPALATAPSDLRLRKRATDSFHQTELQAILAERGVDRLVVCGFQSDFCVDTTTRRALALGYPVTLVADGHSTVDNGVLRAVQISAHHNATLANIASFGPRVTLVRAAELRCAA